MTLKHMEGFERKRNHRLDHFTAAKLRTEKVREIIRSLIRLAIISIVLWMIRTFLLVLPGITIQIPNIPITYSMIVNVVMGVLMIFTVLKFEREIGQPMENLNLLRQLWR